MTEEQLQAIELRLCAITAYPWQTIHERNVISPATKRMIAINGYSGDTDGVLAQSLINMQFIADAPSLVRQLLDEVRRLQADNDALMNALED